MRRPGSTVNLLCSSLTRVNPGFFVLYELMAADDFPIALFAPPCASRFAWNGVSCIVSFG